MLEKDSIKKKVLDYLLGQSLMVLATASPDGKPYATTMLFTVDDDFNFYFISREETRKARNLEDNPRASLSIGFSEPMNVQAEGKVELIEDEKLRGGSS
jgi:pyridoxamine 5'-phosphate oxidase